MYAFDIVCVVFVCWKCLVTNKIALLGGDNKSTEHGHPATRFPANDGDCYLIFNTEPRKCQRKLILAPYNTGFWSFSHDLYLI